MEITKSVVDKILITAIKGLDPVTVYLENLGPRQGQVVIKCFSESWSASWGGMGDDNIREFFLGCDEHYLAGNLSNIKAEVYDIDTLRIDAKEKGVDCYRDDPWNDYEFMEAMYGPDMVDWSDSLPKISNYEYEYLCRIITTIQEALREVTNGDVP